jgi:hypothetical protein
MTTPQPPHRSHRDQHLLPALSQLRFPGSPPPGGWSPLPVADRLIQALERLVDLNEQTARITALYQANLQQVQQAATRRSADARRTRDEDRDRSATYGREV